MASQFPCASEQTIPTPSSIDPEPLYPSFSEVYPQSSSLGFQSLTNALDLSLPPNTLRILAQGQAAGRLPMALNYYAGVPDGTVGSVAAGNPASTASHSGLTMLRSSPMTTLDQPSQVKVRARRAPRARKSKARDIGPRGTPSSSGERTQSASKPNKPTSATKAASSREETTPPTTYGGSSSLAMPAMEPFPWATATSEEIVSRLPELSGIPLSLIDVVLPHLRKFVEEREGPVHSNSWAAGHEQDLPAEMSKVPRVAQPAGSCLQMAQTEPPHIMGQSEPTFPMAEQGCVLDQPPATPPTCGGFLSLSQQLNEDVGIHPIVEEPPSAALHGLLDMDQIWGADVGQTDSSVVLPTGEVIERSPWTGSEVNSSSDVGYGVDLGGFGMEVDLSTFLDGWEGFANV